MLAHLVGPQKEANLTEEQKMISLIGRLELATDCVHKAVQVCQEWDFPGKVSMEGIYDFVRQDNTHEAHKHALIYQLALLIKTILTAKLMSGRAGSQTRERETQKEISRSVKQIE